MRKFIVKNRQKRKYVRRQISQPTYIGSKALAGMLPMIILAVSLFATLLMNLNIREQEYVIKFSFQLPFSFNDISASLRGLPNIFMQPISFIVAFGALLMNGLQILLASAAQGLILLAQALDPRQLIHPLSHGTATVAQGTQYGIAGTANAFSFLLISITTGITTAIVSVFDLLQFLRTGLQVVAASLAIFVITSIITIGSILLNVALIIWYVLTVIFGAVFAVLTAIGNGIVAIVRIPFDAVATLWAIVEPYFSFMGDHFILAGEGMGETFASFGELGETIQASRQ